MTTIRITQTELQNLNTDQLRAKLRHAGFTMDELGRGVSFLVKVYTGLAEPATLTTDPDGEGFTIAQEK